MELIGLPTNSTHAARLSSAAAALASGITSNLSAFSDKNAHNRRKRLWITRLRRKLV
jgi:hypothetical protein